MFTLLRNYRTMFISTIFSGLNNAEGASTPDAVVKPDVETTPEEKAAAEVVRRVTKEDLENVVAVQNYLESHSSIKEGAKGPAVKDIQQILLFLDIDISFTSSRTGKKVEGLDAVDGDYGSTMIKAVKEFQKTHKDPNGEPLDIDGKVGKVTYEAMLVAANIKGEVSAEAATVGVESMSAVKQAERARTIAGEDAFFASETAAAAEAAAAAVEAVAVEARGMIEEARVILAELEDTMSDELGLRERIREAYTAANNVVLEAEITQGADEELQVVASNVRDSAQILVDSAMTVKEAERAQSDAAKIVLEKAENELALVEGNKIGEAAEAKEAENNLAIAQTEFDALGFTGNFDDIPTLIDAEAAAEAAEAAAEAAEAAAEAAEAAAEEAKRAWDEGPFYGSASLKDTMDSTKLASDLARSAATTARSTATTANDLIVISKGYDKVVSAEVVLQAESIDLQDAISDFHLAQVARDSAQAEFDKEKAEFDIATDILSDRILFRNQKDIALTEANKALNEANNALTLAQEEQHKIGMELDTKFEYLEEIRIRLLAIQDAMPGINANFDAVEEAAAEAAAEAAEAAEAADNAGRLYKEARGEYTTTVETQEYNEYYSPEHALAALEGMKNEKGAGAIIAIQKALIVAGANLGPSGADGIAGKLTRVAVQANPDVTLTTLAAYIDATDKAIVEKRVITERPIAGDAIDAALDNLFSDDIDDLNASLDQVAKEFTGKDVDANTRNVNAQYIAIKLQSLG